MEITRHPDHGTGRVPSTIDFRDHDHLLRARLTPRQLTNPTRTEHAWTWPGSYPEIKPDPDNPRPQTPTLDQGDTPQCTGFSALGLLIAGPVYQKRNLQLPSGREIYTLARTLDESPGEDYEGSSVRGAMKALQQLGYVTGYEWAFDAQVAAAWVLYHGPIIFGTLWPDDLFTPRPHRYLSRTYQFVGFDHSQKPQGGGHAYLIRAVNLRIITPDGSRGALLIHNSWGPNWGENGEAWISLKDADTLLKEDGEACTPIEIRK